MRKLLYEYRVLFIILVIPYLFIIVSSIVKVNKDLTVPASIADVSDSISINENDASNVNTVAIYSYTKINLLNYLIGLVNPYAEIEDTYEYNVIDYKENYYSGYIQKIVSINNALIAGYKTAGFNEIVSKDSFKGYIIHTLMTYSPSELEVGDIIIEFNGINFTEDAIENEFENSLENLEFIKDKTYKIKVQRNSEVLEFDISTNYFYEKDNKKISAFGIYTYSYNIPNKFEETSKLYYEIYNSNTLGPSGGLMQSLYIYEALTGFKLTKNVKIVGTGTVDAYGQAGFIGGIKEKVITAHYSGADIFFVPVSSMDPSIYQTEDNYCDALESYNKLKNTKMKLVPVASLYDVINYLNGDNNE